MQHRNTRHFRFGLSRTRRSPRLRYDDDDAIASQSPAPCMPETSAFGDAAHTICMPMMPPRRCTHESYFSMLVLMMSLAIDAAGRCRPDI